MRAYTVLIVPFYVTYLAQSLFSSPRKRPVATDNYRGASSSRRTRLPHINMYGDYGAHDASPTAFLGDSFSHSRWTLRLKPLMKRGN